WQAACGRFALRALEAWAAARAGAVITNSEGMRRRLHDGGVAACKITVVPDALDLARYAPSAGGDMGLVDGGALIGVSIGMAASESCFQLMLAALALLRKRWTGARLLVACDARQLAALRALAMRRALAGQVTALLRAGAREADNGAVAAAGDWQAMVSAAPTAQLHRLADIVVFPQAAMQAVAAPPHKLLEAMARGCVIAAADTPAHRSLIEHGRSGLLFSAGDAAALADALDVLLRGRAGWPAMAAGARWFIEYQRSWEVCAARYVPVYEGLLARRR
ncbi:MAG: glycosyltransferase, exosortase system-associated, partial [Massilia sp.]|nr:glycosyltransferase, exosortase system-associated [Massilia sp.]